MLNKEFLQDLSARITRLLPMAAGVRDDMEKNVRETLQGAFSRLNLVTREEFDAQLKVLARAEQTIAALEEKVAMFEQAQQVNRPAGGDNASQ
jgi:BMFP domain-containing protein YqiC